VSRFQFKIAFVDADTPAPPAGGFLSAQLSLFPSYNQALGFQGLTKNALKVVSFSEAHFTPYVGSGFGPGPQFTITANILPNTTYDICVTPVDEQGKVQHGSTSEVWRFKWTPTNAPPTVPWPARLLPPVRTFNVDGPGVTAGLLQDANFQLDPRYPVGIRIGQMSTNISEFSINYNVRTPDFANYNIFGTSANPDPNTRVFRRKPGGESLLPIVVYRQQVTNAAFPKVSGDVTQVTPLIESIPWALLNVSVDFRTVAIPDRLIALGYDPTQQNYFRPIWLRDQQPVIQGAKYRYYVMRFNNQHEAEEIIPAGEVEIPTN
jgi:hypothetical protein